MSQPRPALTRFLGPRFWPVWLLLGFVRVVCLLPYRPMMAFSRVIGRIVMITGKERQFIARRNIEKCLPELDRQQVSKLVTEHFESLAMAGFETGLAWWASDKRLAPLCHVEGLEHLETALKNGRGAIVLSAHFTCLEICSRMLAMQLPINPVYRQLRNPLLQETMLRGRERSTDSAIPKHDVRQMIRVLKNNGVVWYAPDQSAIGPSAKIVPFFGLPAQSNTTTTRLARLTDAPVLVFLPWRLADGSGYKIVISPPRPDLPSADEVTDTLLFHKLIEQRVREVPEQYLWIHRRFKNIPDSPDFYS